MIERVNIMYCPFKFKPICLYNLGCENQIDSLIKLTYFRSGILNFAAVAMALNDLGYRALGVRIDSGDLAYLSNITREAFDSVSKQFSVEWFANLIIVASNDINEDTILSLNDQGHSIDVFGIGTHLGKC